MKDGKEAGAAEEKSYYGSATIITAVPANFQGVLKLRCPCRVVQIQMKEWSFVFLNHPINESRLQCYLVEDRSWGGWKECAECEQKPSR